LLAGRSPSHAPHGIELSVEMIDRDTFSRGSGVVMGGSVSSTPESVDTIGHVVRSWFNKAWVPSRAVAERDSSRFEDKSSGFGSFASRRPRSKVYGVGFWTVMERGLECSLIIDVEVCAILQAALVCCSGIELAAGVPILWT
jgi:hypothetical protein